MVWSTLPTTKKLQTLEIELHMHTSLLLGKYDIHVPDARCFIRARYEPGYLRYGLGAKS